MSEDSLNLVLQKNNQTKPHQAWQKYKEPRLRSPYLRQLRQIAEGFGQTPRKVVPGKVQHAELRKSSHRPGQIATHAVAAQIELPEPLQLPEHIGQRAGDPVIFQIETK